MRCSPAVVISISPQPRHHRTAHRFNLAFGKRAVLPHETNFGKPNWLARQRV
jgi:hypothetical protein